MTSASEMYIHACDIISAAIDRGLVVRMMGGVAFYHHFHSPNRDREFRPIGDIDLVGYSRDLNVIDSIVQGLGWVANKEFNFTQSPFRLMYTKARCRLDVMLDELNMCHRLDLRERLPLASPTLPLSDLLLTKLQIAQPAQKDMVDIVVLLDGHDIVEQLVVEECIDLNRIIEVCRTDWGFWRTVTSNVTGAREFVKADSAVSVSPSFERKVDELHHVLMDSPKTLQWKMRALLGDRIRWYNVPEEEVLD